MICLYNNNPYLNNSNATEIFPREQVTHEGRLYTKQSYAMSYVAEAKIKLFRRMMKIIGAVALSTLTCFIALAFLKVRKLLVDGIRGREYLPRQRRAEVLLPHQDFFEISDIGKIIASKLSGNDLLALRATSQKNRAIAEKTMINDFNTGIAYPKIAVSGIIDVFGEGCKEITRLDLQSHSYVSYRDIELIAASFPKLDRLLLREGALEGASPMYPRFEGFDVTNVLLKHFAIGKRTWIGDQSFLEHCQNRKTMSFSLTNQYTVDDISFLEYCPNLTKFHLDGRSVNDFGPLQHCKKLTELEVYSGRELRDINFLQHCKDLTKLTLCNCTNINDFEILRICENLSELYLKNLEIKNLNFSQPLPNLITLDLESCIHINDLSFLEQCPNLKYLNIAGCTQIKDLNFLQYCPNLKGLNITNCIPEDFDLSVLSYYPNLRIGCEGRSRHRWNDRFYATLPFQKFDEV